MTVTIDPMKAVAIFFLGTDANSLAAAQNAASRAFGDAAIHTFRNRDELFKHTPPCENELLVLLNSDRSDMERFAKATDAVGARRWAIVALETEPMEGVDVISMNEWVEPVLTRVFETAIVKHQLARQNKRLLGDLRTVAYRISHDLRTPLGGVTTACEVVKECLAEHDPADVSLTAPILSSADELSKLIERVSFVLRASLNPGTKKIVVMGEPISDALQRLERRIIKKNAFITQPDSWPEVLGVVRFLEAIWWNLLANALQHGGDAPRIQLGWNEEVGNFRFWIRDHGHGVSPSDQTRLFQPFHTLHDTNSTRGLGLSITQRLVELQGGHCGYESPADGGALFFFTLPVKKREDCQGAES